MELLDRDLIEQERIAYIAGNYQLAEALHELARLRTRVQYLEHVLDIEGVDHD